MNESEQATDGLDLLRGQLTEQSKRADAAEAKLKAHLIDSGLENAARNARAFSAGQIATLLRPNANLEPAVDANGEPTGEYSLFLAGEDGKRETAREAIDKLRDSQPNLFLQLKDLQIPDDQKYLHESGMERAARLAKESPEKYRRERVKLLGLRPRNGARK